MATDAASRMDFDLGAGLNVQGFNDNCSSLRSRQSARKSTRNYRDKLKHARAHPLSRH